jgi:hypothetical protein
LRRFTADDDHRWIASRRKESHVSTIHNQLFCVHGLGIQLQSQVQALAPQLQHALGEFAIDVLPPDFPTLSGTLHPYDESEVVRHLSPQAVRITTTEPHLELYQDGERFWMIDDRWGLVQINLLKGNWRAWILPQPAVDPVRCFEQTVLWPVAQLLRSRGLWLVPAASLIRGDVGLLVLCSFGIEPELVSLLRSGWRIIGQRWTALREEDGRVAMLRMPGQIERTSGRRLRATSSSEQSTWVDLTRQYNSTWQHHAFCSAVMVIEPGRRQTAALRPVARRDALPVLRSHWPIAELHPSGKANALLPGLVRSASVYASQLSRVPEEWSQMLNHLSAPELVEAVGSSEFETSTRLSA